MAKRKEKYRTVNCTPTSLLDVGELQSLKEEIEEWRDNLSNANMEHLPKFEELSECYDTLESTLDDLEGQLNEVTELIEKLEVTGVDKLQDFCFSILPVKAGRARRAAAAQDEISQGLETLKSALEQYQANYEDLPDTEKKEGRSDDIQEALDKIDEAIEKLSELDDVNFPGMY